MTLTRLDICSRGDVASENVHLASNIVLRCIT